MSAPHYTDPRDIGPPRLGSEDTGLSGDRETPARRDHDDPRAKGPVTSAIATATGAWGWVAVLSAIIVILTVLVGSHHPENMDAHRDTSATTGSALPRPQLPPPTGSGSAAPPSSPTGQLLNRNSL